MTKTKDKKQTSKLNVPKTEHGKNFEKTMNEIQKMINNISRSIESRQAVPGNGSATYPSTTGPSTTHTSRLVVRSANQPLGMVASTYGNHSNQPSLRVITSTVSSSNVYSTANRQVLSTGNPTRVIQVASSANPRAATVAMEAQPGPSTSAVGGKRWEIRRLPPGGTMSHDVLNDRLSSPWTKINALAAVSQATITVSSAGSVTTTSVGAVQGNSGFRLLPKASTSSSTMPRSVSVAWSVAPITFVTSAPSVYNSTVSTTLRLRQIPSRSLDQVQSQPTVRASNSWSSQVHSAKTVTVSVSRSSTSSSTGWNQVAPIVSASVNLVSTGAHRAAHCSITSRNTVYQGSSLAPTSQSRHPNPQLTALRSTPSIHQSNNPVHQTGSRLGNLWNRAPNVPPAQSPHGVRAKTPTFLSASHHDNSGSDSSEEPADAGGGHGYHSDSDRSDNSHSDDERLSDDPQYESDVPHSDGEDDPHRDSNDDGDGDPEDNPDDPESHDESEDTDPDTFTDKERGTDLLSGMYELYKSSELCDVTLLAGDRKFPCHRNVLAASSQYFKSMFTCNLAEASQTEIRIKSIAADILEVILKYLYTGSVKLSKDTVQDLVSAADFLNLHPLKVGCSKYMIRQLDYTNALGVYFFAELTGCSDLEDEAHDHITKHFGKVMDTEEFVALTPKNIQEILSLEFEDVEEIAIYDSVLRWLEHDPDNRRDSIYEVFRNVRFAVIIDRDRFFFFDKVMSNPLLVRNTRLKSLLDDVVHYNMLKERWVEFDFCTTERGTRNVRYIVFTAKQHEESTYLDTLAYYYDFNQPRYPPLNNLYSDNASNVALLGSGDKLFMLGGNKLGDDGVYITRKLHMWYPHAEQLETFDNVLTSRRKNFAFVQVDSDYFVIGGRENGDIVPTVDRFYCTQDWEVKTTYQKPLPVPLSSVCAVGFQGKLYVFGGEGVEIKRSRKNQNLISDEVYCLSPKTTDKWEVVGRMKHARAWAGCSVLNKKIYVIGGGYWDKKAKTKVIRALDSVEIFDPRDQSWSEGPPLPVPLINPGVVKYLGTIYVLGGKYENAASNSVYSLDRGRTEWIQMDDLLEQEGRLSLDCVADCYYTVADMPSTFEGSPTRYSSEGDDYQDRYSRRSSLDSVV